MQIITGPNMGVKSTDMLKMPEAQATQSQAQVDLFAAPVAIENSTTSAVEAALDVINPDNLSPREALDALYQLKKLSAL